MTLLYYSKTFPNKRGLIMFLGLGFSGLLSNEAGPDDFL